MPCFFPPLHQSGELQGVLAHGEAGLRPRCQVGFSMEAESLPNSGLGCLATPLQQVLCHGELGPELEDTSSIGEEELRQDLLVKYMNRYDL